MLATLGSTMPSENCQKTLRGSKLGDGIPSARRYLTGLHISRYNGWQQSLTTCHASKAAELGSRNQPRDLRYLIVMVAIFEDK